MKVKKSIGESLPKYQFRVRSRSRTDEFHLVQVFVDGQILCDCVAGYFKAECWHKKLIKRYLHGKK